MTTSEKNLREVHDHYFKHCFSHRSVVIDFLKANLSAHLFNDLERSTLEKKDTAFLKNKYRNKRNADLLYAIKSKQGQSIMLLLHLEHQSTHDKFMAVRIMEYHAAIARQLVNEHSMSIPTLLTFVLYHGKKAWTSPRSIAELYADFDTYVAESLKRTFLVDLPHVPLPELKKHGAAATPEILLATQSLHDVYPHINEGKACCKDEAINYLLSQQQGKEKELFKELTNLDPYTSQRFTTMFELAIEKASQEAMQQGMQQGIQRIVEKMQAMGFNSEKIEEITSVSLEE